MFEYRIFHSYKPYVLVPMSAIYHNIDFMFCTGKINVITSDETQCEVIHKEIVHICSEKAQKLCKELYNCDVWSFIKRWYNALPLNSMEFLYLGLKKIEKVDDREQTDGNQ